MDSASLRALALALLAVVALSVAAATIDTTVISGGGPSGFGAGDSGGVGSGATESPGFRPTPGDGGDFSIPTPCLPWLLSPTFLGAVVLAFLVLGGLAYRETGSLLPPIAITLALGPPVILFIALLTTCQRDISFPSRVAAVAENASLFPAGGGGALGDGSAAAQNVPVPTALFGVFLVVALAVAVVLLFTSTGDDRDDADDSLDADEAAVSPDVAAVGRAAGAAAQRIEAGDGDVENEVFRAWSSMTELLDVPNRASATPAEFAATAVDAGMSRDDVTALTTLFEEVRYGGFEANTERETRAIDALRNIESTYADGSADASDADDPQDASHGESREDSR
ncbi:DUF4129 domain-containing protein [Haloferax namakaokahaiae]|uniref:DUF4129 domain-containing protein n=1 Tax=Haloferax namakaokahaiae TaxID=1748331 RepID=A0ABD5ZHQ2_9EURY